MTEPLFSAPTTVPEALGLMESPEAVLVAGGTSISLLLKQGLMEPDRLVWLGRVEELHGITRDEDGTLWLGAATTLSQLAASSDVRAHNPMLAEAAGLVANMRVRAVATVGGALVHADPRQDLLPALLASDAQVRVAGPDGERVVSVRDGFFRSFLETAVDPGEVVTHVGLPPRGASSEAYRRFTPSSMDDYPTVSVAARVRQAPSGEVEEINLALGGVASTPLLVRDATRALDGRTPSRADVEALAELAAGESSPTDDERGSAAYKKDMARVWTERTLSELLSIPSA